MEVTEEEAMEIEAAPAVPASEAANTAEEEEKKEDDGPPPAGNGGTTDKYVWT